MADRKNEAARLLSARFRRWLPEGEPQTPEAALRFLDDEGRSWVPVTRTGNTYALWKGMISDSPELDWGELKRRADAGFAEIRASKPTKPRHGKPKKLSVRLAEWPDAFRIPWTAFLNRKSRRASRLDEAGRTTNRSATDSTAEHAFAQFVGAMRRAGRPVEIEAATIQEFIWQKREQKRSCQPRSIGNLLAGTLAVARIAKVQNLDWLLQASLDLKSAPNTGKKSKLLIEPGDIVNAGMCLIAEARTKPVGSKGAKILFRDGLLLVLVAHFPFRRKNLSEARTAHNIIRLEDGRYRIAFSVWEMKKWNDVDYDADLPVSRLIDEFRTIHRDWFVDAAHDGGYLFPSASTESGQLGGDGILRRFKKHSLKLDQGEFGCHDVRRHVASAMMRRNGDARAVAAMLQHEGLGSVDTYARLMNAAAASDKFRHTMQIVRGDVAAAVKPGVGRVQRQCQ
jgi:hypothetical protein